MSSFSVVSASSQARSLAIAEALRLRRPTHGRSRSLTLVRERQRASVVSISGTDNHSSASGSGSGSGINIDADGQDTVNGITQKRTQSLPTILSHDVGGDIAVGHADREPEQRDLDLEQDFGHDHERPSGFAKRTSSFFRNFNRKQSDDAAAKGDYLEAVPLEPLYRDSKLGSLRSAGSAEMRNRRRIIQRKTRMFETGGGVNVKRVTTMELRTAWLNDFYHHVIQYSLSRLIIGFFSAYIMSVFIFALFYWAVGIYSGCVRPADSTGFDVTTLSQAYLFSLETVMTIGYGTKDQFFTGCEVSIGIIITMQSLLGIVMDMAALGLIYERISRGQNRASTIVFSENAVVRWDTVAKRYAFEFRVSDVGEQQLIEARTRCYAVFHGKEADGEPFFFRPHTMRLDRYDSDPDIMLFLCFPRIISHTLIPARVIENTARKSKRLTPRRSDDSDREHGSESDRAAPHEGSPKSSCRARSSFPPASASSSIPMRELGHFSQRGTTVASTNSRSTKAELHVHFEPQRNMQPDSNRVDAGMVAEAKIDGDTSPAAFETGSKKTSSGGYVELSTRSGECSTPEKSVGSSRRGGNTAESDRSGGNTDGSPASSSGSGDDAEDFFPDDSGLFLGRSPLLPPDFDFSGVLNRSQELKIEDYWRRVQMEVIVLVEGTEPTTSSSIQARHSYTFEDIMFNHRIRNCVKMDDDGQARIDYDLFHELREVPRAPAGVFRSKKA